METFDIIIKNGKVIDGAGNPWVKADIGITNERISKMGRLTAASAAKEIDATGLIVCPGFIDPHSHSDFTIPFNPRVPSTTMQGITTCVVGMCGQSLAPVNPERLEGFNQQLSSWEPPGEKFNITWNTFAEYLQTMTDLGCTPNIAPVVGFGTIRIAGGPGYEDREPTVEELERMKGYVAEAMEAGAFGLSTGLIYTPQAYSKTAEIIELAKVAAKYNGLYFSHIRSESTKIVDAVKEVITIVKESRVKGGQIAHMKIFGKNLWGTSTEILQLISDAYEKELNITGDQYPYERSMTSLITAIPPWAHIGGVENLLERLKNPDDREQIKKEIAEGRDDYENLVAAAGWDGLYVAQTKSEQSKQFEGKSIAEITQLKGNPDEFTTMVELLLADDGDTGITCHGMGDEDMHRIMQDRHVMVGTDGWGIDPAGVLGHGKPHPRCYGTYPRVLGRYVREKGVLALEVAIRKMTSFPAQKLELSDRGLLREGMAADMLCFDPDRVIDNASFLDPHKFPTGIEFVLVNGEIVVEHAKQNEKLPGKVLRRPT